MRRYLSSRGAEYGEVIVDDDGNPITLRGTIRGRTEPDSYGSGTIYKADGDEMVQVTASLLYKTVGDGLVVDGVVATPKRTSVGPILMAHFALYAINEGYRTLETYLSAPEEGTPEFYQKLGFQPSQEWKELIDTVIMPAREEQGAFSNDAERGKYRLYQYYSAALQAPAQTVLREAQDSYLKYWEPQP